MNRLIRLSLAITIVLVGAASCLAQDPNDPGAPDLVIIDLSCALMYGNDSIKVPIIVVNDETLAAVIIPIFYLSQDKYWKINTAYFTSDRWQTVGLQGFSDHFDDDPDTSKYAVYAHTLGPYIPPGRDTIATLHFHHNPDGGTVPDPLTMGFAYVYRIGELSFHHPSSPWVIFQPTGTVNLPCNCSLHGDCNGDGGINPVDVVFMVNYVYLQNDMRVQQMGCPKENGDWDCDDKVNPVDVVHIVNYVYCAPAPGPCNPCEWSGDTDPPAAVDDLAVIETNPGALTLGWTAPGNDGETGTASQYQIRYATFAINEANWNSANVLTPVPAPLPAGSIQEAVIPLLSSDSTYYAALKTVDWAGNWSEISNSVSDVPDVDFVVDLPDPNLKGVIINHLNRPGDIVYASELLTITRIGAADEGISDLSGMQFCLNLETLLMEANQIVDLEPLAGLIELTYIQLSGNPIYDISPLAGMIDLETLLLVDGQIADISALTAMTNLKTLLLHVNHITNINSLAGLFELNRLHLSDNEIVDIAPLVANSGLGEGDLVFLYNNPLSTQSIDEYILALQARGVIVNY